MTISSIPWRSRSLMESRVALRLKHPYEEQARAYRIPWNKSKASEDGILLIRNGKFIITNWYRHVCHKLKSEVNRPSRSTEIYQGKEQKCSSLSCLWSKVQQHTSEQGNFQILDCLWRKHHRWICMWNWTEMPTVSFPLSENLVLKHHCFKEIIIAIPFLKL